MNITVFGRRLMPTTSDVSDEVEGSGHASDVPQVCRPLCSQGMELVAAWVCVGGAPGPDHTLLDAAPAGTLC